MIRVTGLTKDYGSRRVINQLSFEAKSGEILGFLGPNGAGKTTTMRILTGYLPPSSGKIEINGLDIMEKSIEVRKIVGYLPETVPLYPDMTVEEYLTYMANLRNTPRTKQRVTEVLDLIHLSDRKKSFISKLSKGMRQRVGIAQAIIHAPKVLILDEPTIGLDPAQIIEVRNLIRELGKQTTILLSTHILSEAQQVCNRVLIINKGQIVAEDSPEHLQTRIAGSQRVTIHIRGDAQELEIALAAIPGVLHIINKDSQTIEVESTPGMEIRPQLARAVIQSGADLLELHAATMSLEDIFLQLTRDEPSTPEMSKEFSTDIMEGR